MNGISIFEVEMFMGGEKTTKGRIQKLGFTV